MTMSLYGRRPSVVRSLVNCTSLMTTPSIETIIFGTVCSCLYCSLSVNQYERLFTQQPGNEAPLLRVGVRPGQQDRNVVAPTIGVGRIDQFRRLLFQGGVV